ARRLAADEAPHHAEQHEREDRVAAAQVPLHPVAADLAGGEREDDECHERPMKNPGREVPDPDARHGPAHFALKSSWQDLQALPVALTCFLNSSLSAEATAGSLAASVASASIFLSKSARWVQISGFALVLPSRSVPSPKKRFGSATRRATSSALRCASSLSNGFLPSDIASRLPKL